MSSERWKRPAKGDEIFDVSLKNKFALSRKQNSPKWLAHDLYIFERMFDSAFALKSLKLNIHFRKSGYMLNFKNRADPSNSTNNYT